MHAVSNLVQRSVAHHKVQDEVATSLTLLSRVGLAVLCLVTAVSYVGMFTSNGSAPQAIATDRGANWWIACGLLSAMTVGFAVLAVTTRFFTWANRTQQVWMLVLVALDVVVAIPVLMLAAVAAAAAAIGIGIAALFALALIFVVIGMLS